MLVCFSSNSVQLLMPQITIFFRLEVVFFFGVKGTALSRLRSFPTDHYQFVNVEGDFMATQSNTSLHMLRTAFMKSLMFFTKFREVLFLLLTYLRFHYTYIKCEPFKKNIISSQVSFIIIRIYRTL